ncbi:DUF6082 family protein [Streptomyces sp. NPDC002685]|uniref:DUF6082 family protein n=1 Tax=Streptomyces sp. NPDC002685 TaxID=3154540 RepID=UPI00331E6EDB
MALVSLVISAAALVGVLISLVYQSRQTRYSREENMRAHHRELLGMVIQDPSLRVCWGGTMDGLPEEKARQITFANMIVSWWQSSYVVKDVTDGQLSLNLESFFRGEIGREYWALSRTGWRDLAEATRSARKKRFVEIVDAKYESAVTPRS